LFCCLILPMAVYCAAFFTEVHGKSASFGQRK
jgi:hypothetical protein